jgi:hypothetical protein
MDALAQLQDITASGGLNATDRSRLNQIANEENTKSRGAREAILQNAQQRGMGGSGLELMAQLQNQQESATRQSNRDTDVAGMAQERALQSLMQQGNMANQISNTSFGQQAQKAEAQDAISKFNAQNQQQVNLANTSARNNAQAVNTANAQAIANQNSNLRNQQAAQKAQLAQQQYENELRKRQSQSGIATQNAANIGQTSQNQANANNQTVGTAISAAAMMSDERCKEEIEDFDASDFLDSLTGHKYKYKDKKHGVGQKAGVMAQDLEKTEIGASLVENTPEGKMVKYGEAAPVILAALAELNDRVKKTEGKK